MHVCPAFICWVLWYCLYLCCTTNLCSSISFLYSIHFKCSFGYWNCTHFINIKKDVLVQDDFLLIIPFLLISFQWISFSEFNPQRKPICRPSKRKNFHSPLISPPLSRKIPHILLRLTWNNFLKWKAFNKFVSGIDRLTVFQKKKLFYWHLSHSLESYRLGNKHFQIKNSVIKVVISIDNVPSFLMWYRK